MLISDVLLSCFVVAIVVAPLLNKSFSFSLIGLSASLALWAKNEGTVIFAATLVSILLFKLFAKSRAQLNLWLFLLAAAPLLLFVLWFKFYIGSHSSDVSAGIFSSEAVWRFADPHRHLQVLKYFLKIIVPDEVLKKPFRIIYQFAFVLAVLFLFAGTSLDPKLRLPARLGWTIICLIVLGYYCSYVLLPESQVMGSLAITFDLDQQLRTTYNRLFFHVCPSIILLLFIMLRTPEIGEKERGLVKTCYQL